MPQYIPVKWTAVLWGSAALALIGATAYDIAHAPKEKSAATGTIAKQTTESSDSLSPCPPERMFHLERLKANSATKAVPLGQTGVSNVHRYLNMTMQNPIDLSTIPRVKIWVIWQNVSYFEGTPPPIGVIDIVQDNCVLYRHQDLATEVIAVAKGNWSE